MAIDVSQMGQQRADTRVAGDIDPRVMQRAAIICGVALLVLVGIKTGFWDTVLP